MGLLSYNSILCLTEAIQKSGKRRYPNIVSYYLGKVIILYLKKIEMWECSIYPYNYCPVCLCGFIHSSFMEFDTAFIAEVQYIQYSYERC